MKIVELIRIEKSYYVEFQSGGDFLAVPSEIPRPDGRG